jgi:hypothetical protein
MADFAVWAIAAGRALGWADRCFLDAYAENQGEAVGLTLDNSPLVGPLSQLLDSEGGDWQGTCQELLGRLEGFAGFGDKPPRNWPRKPRALSGALRRLAPALRKTGLDVAFLERRRGERPVHIRAVASRGNDPATDRHNRHQPSPNGGAGAGPVTVSDGCDGEKQVNSPCPGEPAPPAGARLHYADEAGRRCGPAGARLWTWAGAPRWYDAGEHPPPL